VSFDSGLVEAREILPLPVVGLTEAACHFATLWGERLAVITNALGSTGLSKQLHYRRSLLQQYGVLDRCVGLAPLEMSPEQYHEDLARRHHDEILSRFEVMARRYVDQGAEVIIAGDTILSMALVEHNVFEIPGTGAVVVDLMSSAIKLMEALVDIHRAFGIVRSRAGMYAAPSPGSLAAIRKGYGRTHLGSPSETPTQG
jgi:allantoin racemase